MSQNSVIEISVGDLIPSPTTLFKVLKYLNTGSHGNVVQCTNVSTNETVALKMISIPKHIKCAEKEVAALKTMKELHSDKFNIATLKDSFTHKGYYCLVFEHLDMDLNKFMQIGLDQHLPLEQVRPILKQLARSLEFLEIVGIVHADLRPQKIMMVNHVSQPLKVKIIDFGSACTDTEEQIGDVQQSLFYRSPEILRKAPVNGAIDVWSLGCIAAELFMGIPVFSAWNEADLVEQILLTTGQPLHDGDFLPYSFWPKYWMTRRFMMVPRLWRNDAHAELRDLESFVDLLIDMLQMNPSHRITPRQMLKHPFITMSHFEGPFKNSSYVKRCQDLMDICQDQSSDDGGHGDQVMQTTSLTEDSSSSSAGPAEEDGSAGMREEEPSFLQTSTITRAKKKKIMKAECGNRPDDFQAKMRKSEPLAATGKDTSGQTGPVKPQRKKKREDPTGDGNPSTKKRKVSLEKELTDKSEAAPSDSTQVHSPKKRKRDEEEAPVLRETCPVKKKRAYRRQEKENGC